MGEILRSRLVERIERRLERFLSGDHDSVLGNAALDDAQALLAATPEASEPSDVYETLLLVGKLRLFRYHTDPATMLTDLHEAISFFAPLYKASPDLIPPDMQAAFNLANRLGGSDVARVSRAAEFYHKMHHGSRTADRDRSTSESAPSGPNVLFQAFNLYTQFEQTDDIRFLHTCIQLLENAVAEARGDSERSQLLNLLGTAIGADRSRPRKERARRSMEIIAEAEASTDPMSRAYETVLSNLARQMLEVATVEDDLPMLAEAIDLQRRAKEIADPQAPYYATRFRVIATSLRTRYRMTEDAHDLAEAVGVLRDGLRAAVHNHRLLHRMELDLGECLITRYHAQSGDVDALREAISLFRNAMENTPIDDGDYGNAVVRLCNALGYEYPLTNSLDTLSEIIDLGSAAAANDAARGSEKYDLLGTLVRALVNRFQRTAHREDVDRALEYATQGARDPACPDDLRPSMFAALADATAAKCGIDPPEIVDEPIEIFRAAARLSGSADTRIQFESYEIEVLLRHGARTADVTLLERALRRAGEVFPLATIDARLTMTNYFVAHYTRYLNDVQSMRWLPEVIALAEQTLDAADAENEQTYMLSCGLGLLLPHYFERSGDLTALDRAYSYCRAAVDGLRATGAPALAEALSAMSRVLQLRFKAVGGIENLEAAVAAMRECAAVTEGHSESRAVALANYGTVLRDLARHTQRLDHADEACDVTAEALAAIQQTDPSYPGQLSNLAKVLLVRFTISGDVVNLGSAIDAARRAVSLTSPSDPHLSGRATALVDALNTRAFISDNSEDLDEAIEVCRRTSTAVADLPDHVPHLYQLANLLLIRFDRNADERDRREALECLQVAVNNVITAPSSRFSAAALLGRTAATAGDLRLAAKSFATAIDLLPMMAWHGLDRGERESLLRQASGVASDAAAVSIELGDLAQAVERLEHGRSIVWAQVANQRSDLSKLAAVAPELAQQLEETRSLLEVGFAGSNPGGYDPAEGEPISADSRYELSRRWDSLVQQVRDTIRGFENFLKPVPLAQLLTQAGIGPIVLLNVSDYRCDALILTPGRDPDVVPLPRISKSIVHQKVEEFLIEVQATCDRDVIFGTFAWMWTDIVGLVFEKLALPIVDDDQDPPRIWWCPTGLLALMPIHAAGRYGSAPAADLLGTALDRATSSYVFSISALAALPADLASAGEPSKQLVVGVSQAVGTASALPAVPEELAVLRTHFAPPAHARHLIDGDATRAAIVKALPAHSWVHFICHAGRGYTTASSGGFQVWDGILSIADIANLRAAPRRFAFLSACDTGVGNDPLLSDEAIHLVAALQVIGYRHVVGTLWWIADTPAPLVAADVYAAMHSDGPPQANQAAYAVHHAVRRLRDRFADEPAIWASYIHVGP